MANEPLTKKAFDEYAKLTGHLSRDTLETAYRVLVLREAPSQVAKSKDWSRQRVQNMVNRYLNVINNYPAHWQKITVVLPPKDATEVRELALLRKKELKKL